MTQMTEKTDTLLKTVVKTLPSPFAVEVMGTPWRPEPWDSTVATFPDAQNGEIVRWICFLPTARNQPPAGVTLYEVHAVRPPKVTEKATQFSDEFKRILQREFLRARAEEPKKAEVKGQELPTYEPLIREETIEMAAKVGLVLAVAGLAVTCAGAIASPVPGDEALVCSFAVSVGRAALAR